MAAVSEFSANQIEQFARTLGEAVTGDELTRLLGASRIDGWPAESNTKWRRIRATLLARQQRDHCGTAVAVFIQSVMDPVRFVGRSEVFAALRTSLNQVLAFSGLGLNEQGRLHRVTEARTLGEAEERARALQARLRGRSVHPDVLRFCRAELLADNYFHAVLEATKSIAERIRQQTSLASDGADLVDQAFGIKDPILALNSLRTESEQSEQKGFSNLLKGLFGTFRNPTAHAARICWAMDQEDAVDLLTMASFVHRKLDRAVNVPPRPHLAAPEQQESVRHAP